MKQHIHFVGIGGAGMSALARVLHSRGQRVTGTDMQASSVMEALETELGEPLQVGHSAVSLGDAQLVVASAAIKADNPELLEARRREIPILTRAEMLGRTMDMYDIRIAVSGTHGKTTTSAMTAQMLEHAGFDPTALVGSDVPAWRSNTRIGRSATIVAEACEAYGSFLELRPTHAIVTNIEADHLDHYGTMDEVVRAFRQFAQRTSQRLIVCEEGGAAALLAGAGGARITTYGFDIGADIRAEIVGSEGEFDMRRGRDLIGRMRVRTPGRHNIANALAAAALGLALEIPFETVAAGIAKFAGTARRFEVVSEDVFGAVVVDDYAHHPTEIRATLAAARARYAGRRIVVLFQPHLPSRTRDLMDEFAGSFEDADVVVLTDIYLAREPAMPGIDSKVLSERVSQRRGNRSGAIYSGDLAGAEATVRRLLAPGDVLITMGAGNVRSVGERIAEEPAELESDAAQAALVVGR